MGGACGHTDGSVQLLAIVETQAKELQQLALEHEKDIARLRETLNDYQARGKRTNRISAPSFSTSAPLKGDEAAPAQEDEELEDDHGDNHVVPALRQVSTINTAVPVRKKSHEINDMQLRDKWQGEPRVRELRSVRSTKSAKAALKRGSGNFSASFRQFTKDCTTRLLISPTSMTRLGLDLISIVAIVYDLTTFPLDAFGYSEAVVAEILSAVIMVYWTLDLVLSFFCSFFREEDGQLEVRLSATALRYVKGWFFFDLSVVCMDWVFFFLSNALEQALSALRVNKVARFIRMAKVLRISRLLRVAKLMSLWDEVCDLAFSVALVSALSIVRMLCIVGVALHYIACFWYAIGSNEDPQNCWLTKWSMYEFSPHSWYILSFHWAIAQFTPAPVEVHPISDLERTYNVLVLFIGMAVISSLISNVTALIMKSTNDMVERKTRMEKLCRFLEENRISRQVSKRVVHHSRIMRRRKQKVLLEDDVRDLVFLPIHLRKDLHFEMYFGKIEAIPLMGVLNIFAPLTLKEYCDVGIGELAVEKDETPLVEGLECTSMYAVAAGSFIYAIEGALEGTGTQLSKNDCLCEIAIWCQWKVCADLRASEGGSSLMVVDMDKFVKVVQEQQDAHNLCRIYGQLFVDRMRKCHADGEVVNDLFKPFARTESAVAAIQEYIRRGDGEREF